MAEYFTPSCLAVTGLWERVENIRGFNRSRWRTVGGKAPRFPARREGCDLPEGRTEDQGGTAGAVLRWARQLEVVIFPSSSDGSGLTILQGRSAGGCALNRQANAR